MEQETETTQNTETPVTQSQVQEAGPTESTEIPAWQQALYEANQARRAAENNARQLDELLRQQNAERHARENPPPAPVTLEADDLINNPNKFVDALRQEMRAQIQPLVEFTSQVRRQNEYAALKTSIKQAFPQQAHIITQLEPYIDKKMEGSPITVQAFEAAVKLVVGELAMTNPQLFASLIGGNGNSNTNSPAPVNNPVVGNINPVVNPPHLRPSSAPVPNSNQQQEAEPVLNELEKRLMREQKLTPRQFVYLRDTPPDQLDPKFREKIK